MAVQFFSDPGWRSVAQRRPLARRSAGATQRAVATKQVIGRCIVYRYINGLCSYGRHNFDLSIANVP